MKILMQGRVMQGLNSWAIAVLGTNMGKKLVLLMKL